MSDEQTEHHLQFIRQQILALRQERTVDWAAVDAVLEDLQVTYEHMQANLDAVEVVQAELLGQNQYYQDLFQLLPIASLLTDANGLILEANQAIAQLLHVSQTYLIGKPLAVFVAKGDRAAFRTYLNQLPQRTGTQIWPLRLRPRDAEPIGVELHVAIARHPDERLKYLRIGVYNVNQAPPSVTESPSVVPPLLAREPGRAIAQLPQPLDGLQVLVVDDEADIREFLTMVLETHGIGVRAVPSAAEALEELKRFRPDVLLSDIRMPGESGYQLIRQIRALEAEQGGHLPAAALTAYLDEDQEKSLQAGFEAHLYKLVQPIEWVETITQLARQGLPPTQDV